VPKEWRKRQGSTGTLPNCAIFVWQVGSKNQWKTHKLATADGDVSCNRGAKQRFRPQKQGKSFRIQILDYE